MLRELAVQNLAVIEDVRLELAPGFLAFTGETGAGKSLLLGAVGFLLGERGSTDLIRTGQEELRVTGRFDLDRTEQKAAIEAILEATLDEPELILARRLSRTGRSSAYVNDHPVTIGTLRALGERLVDVHGQHESNSLLHADYQLELLDLFGKLGLLRTEYESIAAELRTLRTRYRQLQDARLQRQKELTLLKFQCDELDAAKIQPGEAAALERERLRLAHAQSLMQFTSRVAEQLYEDEGSLVERLGRLEKESAHWTGADPALAELAQRLAAAKLELRDLAETSRSLSEEFESNPERLDDVERRLSLFATLETKYGVPADELPRQRDEWDRRRTELQSEEDDLGDLASKAGRLFADLTKLAKQLHEKRLRETKRLAARIQQELADLQMPQARFEIHIEAISLGSDPLTGTLPRFGADAIEFMLAANPGEPARPLRKVASGGELSRTMLAVKSVLAAHDPVRTLVVFDEIDANVGGRLGDVLGRKLTAIGQTHQVICVTHLPQVAGYADHHWTIRKTTVGKRTTTTIAPLTAANDRIEELAAMLRGESRSASTRKEAAAMLMTANGKSRRN